MISMPVVIAIILIILWLQKPLEITFAAIAVTAALLALAVLFLIYGRFALEINSVLIGITASYVSLLPLVAADMKFNILEPYIDPFMTRLLSKLPSGSLFAGYWLEILLFLMVIPSSIYAYRVLQKRWLS